MNNVMGLKSCKVCGAERGTNKSTKADPYYCPRCRQRKKEGDNKCKRKSIFVTVRM